MKNFRTNFSDDYAIAHDDKLMLYYGYEYTDKEEDEYGELPDDAQWCFVVKDKEKNKIVFQLTTEELQEFDSNLSAWDAPERYLVAGLFAFFNKVADKIMDA